MFSFPATDVKTFGVSSCFNFSDCPKLPTFDVYAYVGDGSVTTADYGLGTFIRQIVTPDFGEIITIDTTAFLNGLLVANEDFLGLVLRVAPGAEGGLATGLLSVAQGGSGIVVEEGGPIPEPATLALAGAALLGAAAARRRHPTIPA